MTTTKKTKLYFAYGLNLNHDHMAKSVPTARPLGPTSVQGYKLELLAFANIIKSEPKHYVIGGCWVIDEEAEEALDVIEGYPDLYVKARIDNMLVYKMAEHERYFEQKIDFSENEVRESQYDSPYINLIKQGLIDFGLSPETWKRNLEGHE